MTDDHCIEVVVLCDLAPVNAFAEAFLEDEVEPDAGGAAVAFHEWMGDVHFYVFVDDLVECVFRLFLYVAQCWVQIFCEAEGESAFADGLCADLTGKVIETAEEVGVNLLQCLYCSNVFICNEVALQECICFLFALSVYCVVAVGEPVQECVCSIVRIMLG